MALSLTISNYQSNTRIQKGLSKSISYLKTDFNITLFLEIFRKVFFERVLGFYW